MESRAAAQPLVKAVVPETTSRPTITGDRLDLDMDLRIPQRDVENPVISIVIPAVNEELTISDFIAWCWQGLAEVGVPGEILIVDSSSDRTAEIALGLGARVLTTPKRGLGQAYIDAVPFIRGQYVIMGDADCTYDFRKLRPFVDALNAGSEYVMGSRWIGTIEKGSMPVLHQYLGTPFTTWILNRMYGSRFTDIHCGMRAITLDALQRMGLSSTSWDYASEMVLKSVRMELRTSEVPVTFYKDRDGRLSHHKRSGWFSPFSAAWINLRAMFIYRPEFFALKPGLVLFFVGLLFSLPLSFGPISIGSIRFGLYSMLFGVTLAVIGLQSIFMGYLGQSFCDYSGRARDRLLRRFRYTRTMLVSAGLVVLGAIPLLALTIEWLSSDFRLPPITALVNHMAVSGILLVIIGFSTFCFMLVLHASGVRYGRRQSSVQGSRATRYRGAAGYPE